MQEHKKGVNMKRLIIVLVSLLFAVVSYGQNTPIGVESLKSTTDAYIDVEDSNNSSYVWKYGNETSDTLNASETWDYQVTLIKNYDDNLKYEARAALDSISGTPTVDMILQGKYAWNDAWTPLDTVSWTGTSSDTLMQIDYSSAVNYRFARILLSSDATAQKSQVERVEFGVYK